MIKAIIIDDIELTHRILKGVIGGIFKEISIIGQAYNVKDGVNLLTKKSPDIVFLDINLPDGTGFDILNQIQKHNFKIIFVTAHQEYALNAIKSSAFDFLLKPLDEDEVISSIQNAIVTIKKDEEQLKIETFISNYTNKNIKEKKIVLKTQESIYVTKISDIIRCESDGNYTMIFLNNQKKILISKTLKEYDELLKEYGFIRVHKSHLINIDNIVKYEKRDTGIIYMTDESKIPVSHRKKELVLNALNNM